MLSNSKISISVYLKTLSRFNYGFLYQIVRLINDQATKQQKRKNLTNANHVKVLKIASYG